MKILTLKPRLKRGGLAIRRLSCAKNGTRFKLTQESSKNFSYTFKNLQRDVAFSFDAAGYTSDEYRIVVNERPSLLSFDEPALSRLSEQTFGRAEQCGKPVRYPRARPSNGILIHLPRNRSLSNSRVIRIIPGGRKNGDHFRSHYGEQFENLPNIRLI